MAPRSHKEIEDPFERDMASVFEAMNALRKHREELPQGGPRLAMDSICQKISKEMDLLRNLWEANVNVSANDGVSKQQRSGDARAIRSGNPGPSKQVRRPTQPSAESEGSETP